MALKPAVFIDKDGTLVENVPFNIDRDRIRLLPGAIEGLSLLRERGFRLFVVSNQSGIARGYFTEAQLDRAIEHLRELLLRKGVLIDGFLYCPHHPEGKVKEYSIECDCRKPKPGMIHKAASSQTVALSSSWIIGDILDDIEAGHRAGCQAVLIHNGNETQWRLSPERRPEHQAETLFEAASFILASVQERIWL